MAEGDEKSAAEEVGECSMKQRLGGVIAAQEVSEREKAGVGALFMAERVEVRVSKKKAAAHDRGGHIVFLQV